MIIRGLHEDWEHEWLLPKQNEDMHCTWPHSGMLLTPNDNGASFALTTSAGNMFTMLALRYILLLCGGI